VAELVDRAAIAVKLALQELCPWSRSLSENLLKKKATSGRLTSAPENLSAKWACLTKRWLEYIVDLSDVENPQSLETALFEGLEISLDGAKYPWTPNARHAIWAAYMSAIEQERPHDGKIIRFIGWQAFAKRMPHNARRLKSLLGTYSKRSPYALQLEFN
jgi:hypothetical protein